MGDDGDDRDWKRVAALADPTRRRVFAAAEQLAPATAEQLAEAAGISRTLVAHHLDRLLADGLLSRRPGAPRGVGRPPAVYEVAASPEVPLRRYALLADLLAAGGRVDVPALETEARRRAAQAVPRTGGARTRARTALAQLGFAPAQRDGALVPTRCPFLEVAQAHPDVACAAARALAAGVADAVPGATAQPVDDGACCVVVNLPARAR